MTGVGLAKISPYPGYTGLTPSGFVLITEKTSTITMTPFVTGLEPDVQGGGFHVHSVSNPGESECADAVVGGHYNQPDSDTDVWTSAPKYSTDGDGISNHWARSVNSGFTLNGEIETLPVEGKAVVLHSADGEKVACGIIKYKERLEVAILSKIPSYTGSINTNGVAIFSILPSKTLSGLIQISGHSATPAKAHIHSSNDCTEKHGNGGSHLIVEGKIDAWETHGDVVVDLSTGIGSGTITIPYDEIGIGEFTYDTDPLSIHSRAIVIHEAGTGVRIGCGVLTNFGADKTTENPLPTTPGGLELVLAVVVMGIMVGVLIAMYKQHVRKKKNEKNVDELGEDVELNQHNNTMI
ncbi:hypothetical protein TrLO_g6325 [Triparma laevis f. longispina]|uniref:Superoxide dismutase copper/zinc binding domain-containing protein n=1 Tax=Triparma laevis f. longispina TaxID=1714387 RepID=A0A9W7C7U2_9STRA|nr:hypothetical protein TrLO_g6325 [Triparma laevis f. longispina]